MRLDDFDLGVPSAEDGRKLRFLWAKHVFSEAQKNAWVLWVKIGTTIALACGALTSVWTFLHGGGK